jgi:hypothetical protein
MRLIPQWRRAWRWFSVQAFALQGALAAAWLAVPDTLRATVGAEWLAAAAIILTVLGTAGRLVDQNNG